MAEIVVVIAIIAAVLAISLPYFGGVMRRSRLDTEARELEMALLKARLEAIKRGNNTCLLVSTNPSTSYAAKDLSGTSITVTPYDGGLLDAVLYIDSNANGTLDNNETVLAQFPTNPSSSNLTVRIDTYGTTSPTTTASTFNFEFTPFGSSTSPSSTSGSAKAIFISDTSGNVIQVGIPVASTGKVAMTKLSGSSYVSPPWNWN